MLRTRILWKRCRIVERAKIKRAVGPYKVTILAQSEYLVSDERKYWDFGTLWYSVLLERRDSVASLSHVDCGADRLYCSSSHGPRCVSHNAKNVAHVANPIVHKAQHRRGEDSVIAHLFRRSSFTSSLTVQQ